MGKQNIPVFCPLDIGEEFASSCNKIWLYEMFLHTTKLSISQLPKHFNYYFKRNKKNPQVIRYRGQFNAKKTPTLKYLHFGSLHPSLTGLLLSVYKNQCLLFQYYFPNKKTHYFVDFRNWTGPDLRASSAFISSIRPPLPPLVRLASFLAPELSSVCKQTRKLQIMQFQHPLLHKTTNRHREFQVFWASCWHCIISSSGDTD